MAKIKFILDPIGNTLNLWWKRPAKDDFVEESQTTNDVITYDKDGTPKGIEIIGLFPQALNITKALGFSKITGMLRGNATVENVKYFK